MRTTYYVKRTLEVAVLSAIAVISCLTISCGTHSVVSTETAGVWADADCEFVRTGRFALCFERAGGELSSSLYMIDRRDTLLVGRAVFAGDSVAVREVGPGISAGDGLDLGTLQQDGRLRISVGGRERLLTRVEKVEMCAPYEMQEASPLMPGACMQQWCTGVKYVSEKGAVGFECGTNRHSYVFYITPGMVYCRAARLRFSDRGGLFAQNIRLMSNAAERTAYMVEDNLAGSSAPLTVDDSKFSPDGCVFDADGIYWSFIGFDGDVAVLNGCGETYRFARPDADDDDLIEWIAFERY